ncbi:helix-turn-helix domain-containing protein [Streptomyces sp. NPDC056749]|uniref:helix-turn-helix domain-containing protein n=1 Tax=Streptomyces sp. NPDC056749 TaxID=3345936 RepID=UPI0036B632DD
MARWIVRRIEVPREDDMTIEEALALPVAVKFDDSNRALGLGRTTAYELARRGEYPLPLMRLGRNYRVRRSDILRFLGIEDPIAAPVAA